MKICLFSCAFDVSPETGNGPFIGYVWVCGTKLPEYLTPHKYTTQIVLMHNLFITWPKIQKLKTQVVYKNKGNIHACSVNVKIL